MNRKWIIRYVVMFAMSLLLVACAGGEDLQPEVDRLEAELADAQARAEAAEATIAAMPADSGEPPAPAVPVAAGDGSTLRTVQDRGTLACGGNAGLVGFGFLNPDTNEITGFDVEFCRAIAAAIFGEGGADNIEVTPTTGTSRFPTLQSGEVDVLIRNTTYTISRDTSLGFDFGPITFYDGQGMMVPADSGITQLADLEGGSVCVQAGTTTEKNLADVYRALGVDIDIQVYPENAPTVAAYQEGLCDGFTTDKSGLVATQSTFPDPAAHIILEETMSKEPLGPLWRHGDNNWGDIVTWTVYCTMQAEELDITSANVDDFLGSEDPVVQNLLGVTGELGRALGLSDDFCYQIIKQVGNYEEIYNLHLGPDTPIALARGLNQLYTEGGLLYAPPFR